MVFFKKTFLVFSLAIIVMLSFGSHAHAATCANYYQPSVTVPSGYGAAYNVFTTARELVVQVDCTSASPTMNVGSGSALQYIYKLGYVYKGGSWQQINLTSTSPLISSNWYASTASGPLPLASSDLTNWNYLAAYLCTWNGSAWKCGCTDMACTTGSWQLQAVKSSTGSGSSNGSTITPGNGTIIDATGNKWTIVASGQVAFNGGVITGTANVIQLLWVNNTIWQETSSGDWYSIINTNGTFAAGLGPTKTYPVATANTSTNPTGNFHIAGGKIYDPNGVQFIARGVNINDNQLGQAGSNSACQPLTSLFPGINFVRVPSGGYSSASSFQDFINKCTANKIVVELEHHPWPALDPLSGSGLNDESNWYAGLAATYKDNPYVWFGTMNEPQGGYGSAEAAISAQEASTYSAIRGAGASNILMMESGVGGGNPGTNGSGFGFTNSSYAGMTNVVWDMHFYGWISNYNTDQNVVNSALTGSPSSGEGITAAQTIRSADGVIPVIIGEFSPQISDTQMAPNGNQVVAAVTSLAPQYGGYVAWSWNADGTSQITPDGGQSLTAWGQQLKAAIVQ